MNDDKPFSQACENNKSHILKILKKEFANSKKVLEIGSGTGQHAVHFAPALPHVSWQTADQTHYHSGILAWMAEYPSDNLLPPLALSLPDSAWPQGFDAYFSANTAHIMQKDEIKLMMELINHHLPQGGVFCQYGPFTQDGEFSSQSNLDFHHKLLSQGYGGYRDIEELKQWAPLLMLEQVNIMPANNLLLVWRKR